MLARMRHATAAVVALPFVLATACAGAASGREDARPAPSGLAEHGAHAVSTVTEADFATTRVGRIEEVLMARVPGLTVLRLADGEYSLRIRGHTSFGGNDEPLVVIDGMPIRPGGASNALATLAPSDVARVEVLKDAGAAAAYGIQGGNGVVVITTRRGR
jgi:iron complex outermembrane receptor protein